MKFKKALIAVFVMFVAIPGAAAAIAKTSQNAVGQENAAGSASQTQNEGSTSSQKAANAIRNCEKIEAKVQTKLENYSGTKTKHMSAYNNMVSRLEKFIENIKANGYDTTVLEADLVVLKQKIEEFSTLTAAANTVMTQTKLYTCSDAEKTFKNSLTQTRSKVRLAYQKASEIRTFYRDVIRVDLQDIKEQNPGAVSNDTSNSGSDSDATDDSTTTSSEEE